MRSRSVSSGKTESSHLDSFAVTEEDSSERSDFTSSLPVRLRPMDSLFSLAVAPMCRCRGRKALAAEWR